MSIATGSGRRALLHHLAALYVLRVVEEASDALKPGERFARKYTIVRLIASGGMGVVYEATHERLGSRVALKTLHARARQSSDIVARFEREARAAVALRGPHVARVFDVDVLPDGSPFMVMEYLEGRDLFDEMRDRTVLPTEEAVGYVLQACAAMSEAHRVGIVHRDLTPGNLFLANDAEGRIVKVLDFGISKVASEADGSVTSTHSTLGTPFYMSPEQVRSAKHVDARSDIWSLGTILYEMLAGRLPFPADNPSGPIPATAADPPTPLSSLRPELPRELTTAVMTALEKDPSRRFQQVEAFADAIAPYGPRDRGVVRTFSDVRRSRDVLDSRPERAAEEGRAARAPEVTGTASADPLRPPAPTA